MDRPDRLIVTGLVGGAVTAICCFTPVLVVGLAVLGLSALVGWLDYVLLPLLGLFLLLLGAGLLMRARGARRG